MFLKLMKIFLILKLFSFAVDTTIKNSSERIFSSNWRVATLTLFSDASFTISKRRSPEPLSVACQKNSTLVIFGRQLSSVPKRPDPPTGKNVDHLLAIGLIDHVFTHAGRLKGTQIIFYWFCMPSDSELKEWIIAFDNSLLNQKINKGLNFQSENSNKNFNQNEDDLSLGLLMANTTIYTNNLGSSVAAIGAAGVVAASTQHQLANGESFFDNQRSNPFIFLSENNRSNLGTNQIFSESSNYFADDPNVNNFVTTNDISNNYLTSLDNNIINNLDNLNSIDNVPIAELNHMIGGLDFSFDSNVDCFDASGCSDFSTVALI